MSFTLICNNCGNKVELLNNFERLEKSVFINIFESLDITCESCGNTIEGSV